MWMLQVWMILLSGAGVFFLGRWMRADPVRIARAFRSGLEPVQIAVRYFRFVGAFWMVGASIATPIAILGVIGP